MTILVFPTQQTASQNQPVANDNAHSAREYEHLSPFAALARIQLSKSRLLQEHGADGMLFSASEVRKEWDMLCDLERVLGWACGVTICH